MKYIFHASKIDGEQYISVINNQSDTPNKDLNNAPFWSAIQNVILGRTTVHVCIGCQYYMYTLKSIKGIFQQCFHFKKI